MTDRPILFSSPMVRAILEGRKTQTRRIIKPQPPNGARYGGIHFCSYQGDGWFFSSPTGQHKVRERWMEGDRLWVRETCAIESQVFEVGNDPPFSDGRPIKRSETYGWLQPHYAATDDKPDLCCLNPRHNKCGDDPCHSPWAPSIHMPRWASRITLIVEAVRVQRLQEISEADAVAEGVTLEANDPPDTARAAFYRLWESIHGPGSWDANPFVAAITFRPILANIDARQDCPRCDGLGEINPIIQGPQTAYTVAPVECPECDGTGEIDAPEAK